MNTIQDWHSALGTNLSSTKPNDYSGGNYHVSTHLSGNDVMLSADTEVSKAYSIPTLWIFEDDAYSTGYKPKQNDGQMFMSGDAGTEIVGGGDLTKSIDAYGDEGTGEFVDKATQIYCDKA